MSSDAKLIVSLTLLLLGFISFIAWNERAGKTEQYRIERSCPA
jgi:hypothetical protein